MSEANQKPRAFSGIQPTGDIHLGNYLGALQNWVAFQDSFNSVYCIVDLHALTTPKDAGEVAKGSLKATKTLLAVGIDPAQSVLFAQSQVREHTELAWLLMCTVSFGELRRMTQFKDKSESAAFTSAGLFTYPALQAADILLYDTDVVPVGDDQRQHIELTRDIAERFNNRYGDTLILPEHRIPSSGARVMNLQDPVRKMSKSAESPQGVISIKDTPAQITKKIKRAVTDNDGEVRFNPSEKPGVSNLLAILGAVTKQDPNKLASDYTQYGPLKADTAEAIVTALEPIQKRYADIDDHMAREALNLGAEKAQAVATQVMDRVRKNVGLLI